LSASYRLLRLSTPDSIHELVVSRRRYQAEGLLSDDAAVKLEVRRQVELRYRNLASLANNFAEAGFLTIIDDVFSERSRYERFVASLRVRPVYLAILAPKPSVAELRDRHRPEKTVYPTWAHLDAAVRSEFRGLGYWVDSSAQSPEETAEDLLAHVWTEGLARGR
jgi:hypothetical protein